MKRTPMTLFAADDDAPRMQVGALCWRLAGDRIEVLLATSRETGRWIIPKGWPIDGLTPAQTAAREAWEEAGVRGTVADMPVGIYSYDKVIARGAGGEASLPCVVTVYPLEVGKRADNFPEADERRRKWFARDKAARKVAEPELQALIAQFVPGPAGGSLPQD